MIALLEQPASAIEIKDIGKIENLTVTLEPGTITVLRGDNGTGKSTALSAIESLTSGKTSVTANRQMEKGSIAGFGAKLTVGKTSRRTGQATITAIEGSIELASFVDPHIKDPEAADRERIKRALVLLGSAPKVDDFACLFHTIEDFRRVVGDDLNDATDVVEMAARVKRLADAAARTEESAAVKEYGQCVALTTATKDVPTDIETDGAVLQAALESAVAKQSRLTSLATEAKRMAEQKELAENGLAEAEKFQPQDINAELSSADAQYASALEYQRTKLASVKAAQDALAAAQKKVDDEQAALKETLGKIVTLKGQAERLRQQATEQAALIASNESAKAGYRRAIEAAGQCQAPADSEIVAAAEAVTAARKALEAGAIAREAKRQRDQAYQHDNNAVSHRVKATRFRDAGAGTDRILSDLLVKSGTALQVRSDRLFLKAGETVKPFAELSAGERWRVAIDLALLSFKPEDADHFPILTIPQEAWEGLSPRNQQEVLAHVKERQIAVATGACSNHDRVTVEVLK